MSDTSLNLKNTPETQKLKNRFQQTKQYIFLKEVTDDLKSQLPDETFLDIYPLTNSENSRVFTSGLLGMNYVRTPKALAYRDLFQDLRGNRLLIFTNQRIIFLVVVEYLEEGLFYSYPYESLENVHVGTYHSSLTQLKSLKGKSPEEIQQFGTKMVLLDFESGDHYLTEYFSFKDLPKLMTTLNQIPQLKGKINRHAGVFRKRKWDYIFGNPVGLLKYAFFANYFWYVLLAVVLVVFALAFFGIGPWSGLIP